MWFLIPFRNLTRNLRRTALSLAIIGLGTALSFVVLGFVYSSVDIIQENLLKRYGNFQIAREGAFNSDGDLDSLILPSELDSISQQLEASSEVVDSTKLLTFSGLLNDGSSSLPVNISGIEPDSDVISYDENLITGTGLDPGRKQGFLAGEALVRDTGLELGDQVTLFVRTGEGRGTGQVELLGVFKAQSEEVGSRQIYLPFSYAQELVGIEAAGRVAVALEDRERTDSVATSFQEYLDRASGALSVKTWQELSSFYEMLTSFFTLIFGFLVLVVSLLVFFIILEVLTLSFLERSREVGTIRALGTRRGEVFRIFVVESIVLGSLGAVIGLLLGAGLALAFNLAGINWTPPGSIEPVVLTVKMSLANAWPPVLIALGATVISSFYPAYRMANTDIVGSLRVEE